MGSTSYPRFPEDVKDTFRNVIDKYHLTVEAEGDYSVQLSNEHARITFYFGYGELDSYVYRKNDDYQFGIEGVYRFLFGANDETYSAYYQMGRGPGYPKSWLNGMGKMFEGGLSSLLEGDFSWYEKYKSELEYDKKLYGIALSLDYHYPVYKIAWEHKSGWQNAVLAYIKENKIEI